MNDLEISKALALAIGWKLISVYVLRGGVYIDVNGKLKRFDYCDEVIAFRVAERFDCFPTSTTKVGQWYAYTPGTSGVVENTPQKAIALAVIQGAKK